MATMATILDHLKAEATVKQALLSVGSEVSTHGWSYREDSVPSDTDPLSETEQSVEQSIGVAAMECIVPAPSEEPPQSRDEPLTNLNLLHACFHCRASKTACADQRPCNRCCRLGLQCSEGGEPRKRACKSCHSAKVACGSNSSEDCARCQRLNIPCIPRALTQGTPRRKRARAEPPIVYFSDGNQQASAVAETGSLPCKPRSPTLPSNMASISASLLDLSGRKEAPTPTMVVQQPSMFVAHFGRFITTSVPQGSMQPQAMQPQTMQPQAMQPQAMQPQVMQPVPLHLYMQLATQGGGNLYASVQQPTPARGY